ncbi:hypothetical protein KI688_011876 [Linnemannia hyalina]|uniref:DDE Tnp4 domain-containing protein n=1 Tax=Linnemannia hyalina TaxID=64524 RepID=A0A9P7XZ13_9FUNG|nr:hypothetical protein KI688_011876 [Linnemannia hyalina]
MAQYMPKSTFHLIYSTFVKVERALFEKEITRCFASMFSSLEIRIRTANWKNPPMFKHVTLYLDGHDSRTTYGEDKAAMYSYKLKKSGLRTQVAIDANGMVLFVSKSASCRDNNDGKMLQEMGIGKKINNMDCIALDGGYTQYIGDIVEKEKLDERNFCFPIRKKRLQQLHEEESNFNAIFGGFRSTSEAVFGDLMKTFAKFNNKEIVRVGSKKEFNLTLRLCLLLLNVRNFVKAVDIEELPHHRGWMEEGYVQLTIELITKAFETFSSKKGVEFNKKDANKIFKALDEDDEVERYYFCGEKCTKSKRKCMKEVDDEGMHCYVHDPARKCQGTTIKGANCGSVAKLGETYCGRHREQHKGHMKSSNNKAPANKRTKSSKMTKKTHTPEFVPSDADMTSEDEEPKKRKKNKQESSDEEPSDDDDEEDIIAVSFPLSPKVVDITSKKNVPLANTCIWTRYATNPAFLYAKSFTVNGKYIIRLKEKNLYIALCPPKLMGKNLPAPEISEKEARILAKMGLQEATSADVEKIEESSADENSDDDTDDGDTSDNADSDDDSSKDKDSDDGKSNNRPDVESGDDTSKDNPDEKLSHKKPSKDDEKKISRKKRHSEMPKNAEPSSNVDVSKDEKDEHTFALATTVRNIRSEKDIPLAKDGGWMVHPNNDMLEYATNFTMKAKYIVKLCGKNTYVGLFTLDHLRGGGDVPEMDILERSMLSKMKLQEMSDEERKMLFNEEVEVEEELPVEGPTDISKMKWKRFHKQQLEYSKNVLVNGKHILKIRKQNIVVGW